MKACPDVPILITQSRLCKNAYDEVDLFPQIGNEYYATVIGAVFHADEIITSLRSDEICFEVWNILGLLHTVKPRILLIAALHCFIRNVFRWRAPSVWPLY